MPSNLVFASTAPVEELMTMNSNVINWLPENSGPEPSFKTFVWGVLMFESSDVPSAFVGKSTVGTDPAVSVTLT